MRGLLFIPLLALALLAAAAPDAPDTLVLRARDAAIEGNARHMGDKIGAWDDLAARVRWTTTVARTGSYRVLFEYACPSNCAGTDFEVRVGSQRANGTIADTGGWGSYVRLDLGPVFVRKPGPCLVEVATTRSPRKRSMMDLRTVTLQREE